MVLDPDNEFNVDRTLTKDDVQKLIMVRIGRKDTMFHVHEMNLYLIIVGIMIRRASEILTNPVIFR